MSICYSKKYSLHVCSRQPQLEHMCSFFFSSPLQPSLPPPAPPPPSHRKTRETRDLESKRNGRRNYREGERERNRRKRQTVGERQQCAIERTPDKLDQTALGEAIEPTAESDLATIPTDQEDRRSARSDLHSMSLNHHHHRLLTRTASRRIST